MKKSEVEELLRNGKILESDGKAWSIDGKPVAKSIVTSLLQDEKVKLLHGEHRKLHANPKVLF